MKKMLAEDATCLTMLPCVLEGIRLKNIQYEYRTNQYTKTNMLIIMKA